MRGSMLACAVSARNTVQAAAGRRILSTTTFATSLSRARSYATSSSGTPTTTVAATTDAPQSLELQDGTVAAKKERSRIENRVNGLLKNTDDPWVVGKRVAELLKGDQYDEALLLAQRASRNQQVVVSWNHLIGYAMQKQKLRAAVKLYNDMKKRAQLPSVQTYTIIFSGCAKSEHPKIAVAEAMRFYNSLLNDGRIQPNSTHLNAVLNVCAKAQDLDNMFLVANSINETTRQPTAWTYSTILHALRQNAIIDLKAKDLASEQQSANVEKVVGRAKSLWVEVMDKWRKGKLVIDEELVCAMARILLLSKSMDQQREVLDLLQQVMNIPNLSKSPGGDPFVNASMQQIAVKGVPVHVPKSKAVYVIPGKNTLAVVLTTVTSARLTTIGIKYWNLLVRNYGILPDQDNWDRLFVMLKVAKASGAAAACIDLLPDQYVNAKIYRSAMDTCVRDNINHNGVKNATVILQSMMKRLKHPDLMTLRLYLRVALVSHFHFRASAREGKMEESKRKYGTQITDALSKLWEPYKQTHYHYFKASTPSSEKDKGVLYNNKREVIALARAMFSAFNKVINEKMLPEKDLQPLRSIGAKINREIQKFYADREQNEPNLPRVDEENDDEVMMETRSSNPRRTADFIWDTAKPVGRASSEY